MADKETIYATLIDFVGVVSLFISMLYFKGSPLALILPLVCYTITYMKFKEKFWKAFILSFVLAVGLVFLYLLLLTLPLIV